MQILSESFDDLRGNQAAELMAEYYHSIHGVDIRGLRYPGLISWKVMPGGGTTDYAVEIFHKAVASEKYTCFVNRQTRLPMMYMDDAIKATLQLMDAPSVPYPFVEVTICPASTLLLKICTIKLRKNTRFRM